MLLTITDDEGTLAVDAAGRRFKLWDTLSGPRWLVKVPDRQGYVPVITGWQCGWFNDEAEEVPDGVRP